MPDNAMQWIMAGAVVVSAAAIVIQLVILYGMYRQVKPAMEQVTRLAPKVETLVETAQRTVEQSKTQILEITAKMNAMMDTTRTQLIRIDEVLADATTRAKVQLDRVELVVDDTVSRVHETVTLLHRGVLRPLREVAGITTGVRAAFAFLMRGGRPNVAQATSDEEMFI